MRGSLGALSLSLAMAFDGPRAAALAGACGIAMFGLLAWNSGGLTYYPSSGWELYTTPLELVSMLVLALLFGVLVPLQVAAVRKARASVTAAGGLAGTAMAVLGVSCCAPLLLPALLSFVGFSGTALLGVNATVRAWSLPLTLVSVGLMLLSIVLVSRTLAASCKLR
jgi:hypothetical protein